MERKRITLPPDAVPQCFKGLIAGADVYDSSCSDRAKVYYIDSDAGCFLKSAPADSLMREAEMTRYFHRKGLAARVLEYHSEGGRDWLLTERVAGEDCICSHCLDQPRRLARRVGELLRRLHSADHADCPVQDRIGEYIAAARRGYMQGQGRLHKDSGYTTLQAAYETVERMAPQLKNDVLIHGDYCLPNIILDDWRFSGFIDLDNAGVGDRHIDLYWGLWSLRYNLKTDRYAAEFLDAYGREAVDMEVLDAIRAFEVFG